MRCIIIRTDAKAKADEFHIEKKNQHIVAGARAEQQSVCFSVN